MPRWILRGNPLTAVAAVGVFSAHADRDLRPWIVPYDPIASNVSQRADAAERGAHWAGTDQLGRDVFSRLIVAARLDLAIADLGGRNLLAHGRASSVRSAAIPVAGSIAASAASSTW